MSVDELSKSDLVRELYRLGELPAPWGHDLSFLAGLCLSHPNPEVWPMAAKALLNLGTEAVGFGIMDDLCDEEEENEPHLCDACEEVLNVDENEGGQSETEQ